MWSASRQRTPQPLYLLIKVRRCSIVIPDRSKQFFAQAAAFTPDLPPAGAQADLDPAFVLRIAGAGGEAGGFEALHERGDRGGFEA